MNRKIKCIISIIIFIFLFNMPVFAFETLTIGYTSEGLRIHENKKGRAEGFLVDLLDKIFIEEDQTVVFVPLKEENSLKALGEGQVDFVIGDESFGEKNALKSHESPLMTTYYEAYLHKDIELSTPSAIYNLTFGYLDPQVIHLSDGLKVKGYGSEEAMLTALKDGKIQGILTSQNRKQHFSKLKTLKSSPLVLGPRRQYLMSTKNTYTELFNQIDYYLYHYQTDAMGIYNEIFQKHYFEKTFFDAHFYKLLLGTSLFLLMILFLRYVLKKQREKIKQSKKALMERSKQHNVLNNKFENLIQFLSFNMKKMHLQDDAAFLSRLLKEIYNLIDEADYGIVFTYDKSNHFQVVDTIALNIPKIPGFYPLGALEFGEDVIVSRSLLRKIIGDMDIPVNKEYILNQIPTAGESLLINFSNNQGVFCGVLLEMKGQTQQGFSKESIHLARILKDVANAYFLNENLHEIQENFQKEIIFAIVQMLEIHDEYTKGHSESVANLSSQLARCMGLSDTKANEIYWAGLVHDIGKILISRDIINKTGRLSFKEHEIIKKHPVYGYKALSQSKVTHNLAKYVLHHHERVDGSGYPDGLIGDEIPLESRIICIADSYDAMVSKRSYRASLSKEQAIKEIQGNLGTQFDREIGELFIKLIEVIENE